MQPHWTSTKLWLTVFAMALMLIGFLLAGSPQSLYGDFCMGVVAAAFGFKAANVLEKRRDSKAAAKPTKT